MMPAAPLACDSLARPRRARLTHSPSLSRTRLRGIVLDRDDINLPSHARYTFSRRVSADRPTDSSTEGELEEEKESSWLVSSEPTTGTRNPWNDRGRGVRVPPDEQRRVLCACISDIPDPCASGRCARSLNDEEEDDVDEDEEEQDDDDT